MKAKLVNQSGEVLLVINPETDLEDCALQLFSNANSGGTGEHLNVIISDKIES
jgi:hypothetical protein